MIAVILGFSLINTKTNPIQQELVFVERKLKLIDESDNLVFNQESKTKAGVLETTTNLLDEMAISEKNLQKQLKYKGYSETQINYALTTLEIDFNNEALEAAIKIRRLMPIAKEQLIRQLLSEGYRPEQVQFAIDSIY